MKRSEFSHWSSEPCLQGLLFFAQSLKEMLFHYGHDSLKVSALNFNFLCVEIEETIKKIEDGVVDSGNMKPLIEELRESFKHDYVAQKLLGTNFDSLFFTRNLKGEIDRNSSQFFREPTSEASIKAIKRVIHYMRNIMNMNTQYYTILKDEITNTIKEFYCKEDKQEQLYQLSRILITDLINRAYSKEYIYWVVNNMFCNKKHRVDDVDKILKKFWSYFDFKEKEYTIELPYWKTDLKPNLKNLQGINIKDNDEKFLEKFGDCIIEVEEIKAKDPYKAKMKAEYHIEFFASLWQYTNHASQIYKRVERAVVIDNENGKSRAYKIKVSMNLLERENRLSIQENSQKLKEMIHNLIAVNKIAWNDKQKLMTAIELHASALNSNEVSNQLLNLWTIIEVLIPIERKNSFPKINQICNVITTALNEQYILSLITQLFYDLSEYAPEVVEAQLSNVDVGKNGIEKIVAILVIKKYETVKDNILQELTSCPLLKYRIKKYSEIFSEKTQLKSYLMMHRQRISWHLIRIYRNRNMIVHDGSYFPYIDIIIQNLHHYVDVLIDTINFYLGKGYTSIETIYTILLQQEYQYLCLLETKDDIDDDFLNVVLGYSRN